jgi:hypothetical protein
MLGVEHRISAVGLALRALGLAAMTGAMIVTLSGCALLRLNATEARVDLIEKNQGLSDCGEKPKTRRRTCERTARASTLGLTTPMKPCVGHAANLRKSGTGLPKSRARSASITWRSNSSAVA